MGFFSGILDAVGLGSTGMPWGSIVDGVTGLLGQESTNDQNMQISTANNAFNAQQAEFNRQFQFDQSALAREFNTNEAATNRAFQERMSNTQYQRAVGDMQQAGLNPMLAYGQGGAGNLAGSMASTSAPSGSTASSAGNITLGNKYAAGLSAAQQAATIENTVKQGKLIDSQTYKTNTEALVGQAQIGEIEAREAQGRASAGKLAMEQEKIAAELPNIKQQLELLKNQTDNEYAKTKLTQIQQAVSEGLIELQKGQLSNTQAQELMTRVEANLKMLSTAYYETENRIAKSGFGEVMQTVQKVIPTLRITK